MGFFFIPGTGLQIPPAAQQALQMSGSLAFSAVAGKINFYIVMWMLF